MTTRRARRSGRYPDVWHTMPPILDNLRERGKSPQPDTGRGGRRTLT